MADFHMDPVQAGLAGVFGTAVLGWLGNRLVGKAAIQTAVNQGFKEMMDQMRQELRVAIHERDDARELASERLGEIEVLRRTIGALELRVAEGTRPPADFKI